jgi:hypothetical protein
LSDLADLLQGNVYGGAVSSAPVNLYRWSDGSLLIDQSRAQNLVQPAAAVVIGGKAQLTVRASDDRGRIAAFEYSLDGGPVVRLDAAHNTLTVPLSLASTGSHTFSVVAVDPAGNRSAATAYNFTSAAAAPLG